MNTSCANIFYDITAYLHSNPSGQEILLNPSIINEEDLSLAQTHLSDQNSLAIPCSFTKPIDLSSPHSPPVSKTHQLGIKKLSPPLESFYKPSSTTHANSPPSSPLPFFSQPIQNSLISENLKFSLENLRSLTNRSMTQQSNEPLPAFNPFSENFKPNYLHQSNDPIATSFTGQGDQLNNLTMLPLRFPSLFSTLEKKASERVSSPYENPSLSKKRPYDSDRIELKNENSLDSQSKNKNLTNSEIKREKNRVSASNSRKRQKKQIEENEEELMQLNQLINSLDQRINLLFLNFPTASFLSFFELNNAPQLDRLSKYKFTEKKLELAINQMKLYHQEILTSKNALIKTQQELITKIEKELINLQNEMRFLKREQK